MEDDCDDDNDVVILNAKRTKDRKRDDVWRVGKEKRNGTVSLEEDETCRYRRRLLCRPWRMGEEKQQY